MSETVISIKTAKTPNPNTLKYNFNRVILPVGSAEYLTAEDAKSSPLALRVFEIKGIERVLIGTDFLALTKQADVEWSTVNSYLAPKLEEFFESGEKAVENLESEYDKIDFSELSEEDRAVAQEIEKIMDNRVRPAVAQDGGDIILKGYKDNIVYVQLFGACSGCPSSSATLKHLVENAIKEGLANTMPNVTIYDVIEVQG